MEGATTSCNWSGALCLFICFVLASVHKSQAGKKQLSQHQLERRPQVSRAQLFPHTGFDSPRLTRHTNPCAHFHCCHSGIGDGTEGWPIKYLSVCCAECRLSRLGKCYVGIKVEAVPDRKTWLCRTRNSIHFAFSSKKYVVHLCSNGLQICTWKLDHITFGCCPYQGTHSTCSCKCWIRDGAEN